MATAFWEALSSVIVFARRFWCLNMVYVVAHPIEAVNSLPTPAGTVSPRGDLPKRRRIQGARSALSRLSRGWL
jgi:hypothetical protein